MSEIAIYQHLLDGATLFEPADLSLSDPRWPFPRLPGINDSPIYELHLLVAKESVAKDDMPAVVGPWSVDEPTGDGNDLVFTHFNPIVYPQTLLCSELLVERRQILDALGL